MAGIFKKRDGKQEEQGKSHSGQQGQQGKGHSGQGSRQDEQQDIRRKADQNILRLTYVVVFVFILMIAYEGYFLATRRENVINNVYNARLDAFSERIVRGKIVSNDGTVLAETVVGEDGTETRHYPYGSLFAHSVGYSTRGKTGLESLGNFYLLTSHVNLVEQTVNEFYDRKNLGDTLYTTLDLQLQQVASDALGDRKGAVIAMEPDTGRILVMVSKPGFDPNTLNADWDNLVSEDNDQAQLLNRVTQGLYPPGSTFKIVTLLEYIREHPKDYMDFHYDCNGFYQVEDYTIQCYHGMAHGSQDLKQAFANSCNGAFASLGQSLDLKKLSGTAEELLFEKELPSPLSYKKSNYAMKEGADTWTVLQTSIGQGKTQVTPLHNALLTAAIANGGVLMKPYMMDHVENVGGETIRKFEPDSYGSLMTKDEAGKLTEMMQEVVRSGTGSALLTDAYTVAGKTGSAEFETGKETHAWFTGFAPAEDPKLVVTVLVEEGGSGGKQAGPIARSIFDTYLSR